LAYKFPINSLLYISAVIINSFKLENYRSLQDKIK